MIPPFSETAGGEARKVRKVAGAHGTRQNNPSEHVPLPLCSVQDLGSGVEEVIVFC
jgi:hypothetical protein